MKRMNMKTKVQVEDQPYRRRSVLFCIMVLLLLAGANRYCAIYRYPPRQILEFAALLITTLALAMAKMCRIVSIPELKLDVFLEIWPLSLLYLARTFFTVEDLRQLSLEVTKLTPSLFILLTRSSIIMIVVAEFLISNIKPSFSVQTSVCTVILGSAIAASADIGFDPYLCMHVLGNNFFFVAYLLYANRILSTNEVGVLGLFYYSSLFVLLPLGFIAYYTNDIESLFVYVDWSDVWYISCISLICFLGILAIYATIFCTFHNTPLTTAVAFCFKDICLNYGSMIVWKEYVFSVMNFCSLNVSVVGCLIYAYVIFRRKYRRIYHF